MKEFISAFILRFEEMRTSAFQYGYITGVALTILMLLLLLYYLFRAPVKSRGIMLATPNGTLFIAASAISDLVREVEKNFTTLKILKSTLLEKKGAVTLELKINFPKTEENTSLPAVAESFFAATRDTAEFSPVALRRRRRFPIFAPAAVLPQVPSAWRVIWRSFSALPLSVYAWARNVAPSFANGLTQMRSAAARESSIYAQYACHRVHV